MLFSLIENKKNVHLLVGMQKNMSVNVLAWEQIMEPVMTEVGLWLQTRLQFVGKVSN